MRFILASSSPRRRQLLKEIVPSYEAIEPSVNEPDVRAGDAALPQEISKHKAYAVFRLHPEATVLACDTIVYFKGHKLGKPKTYEEATAMLTLLSGKSHKVITGYTLLNADFEVNRTVVTRVQFRALNPDLIQRYIQSGSPFDKAGGYGIQDREFDLVEKIEGSYSNVMGLPLEDIAAIFKKFKLNF